MRDRLTIVGVAAALAAVLGLSAVGRANACSCAMLSEAEQLAAADIAFVGVAAAVDAKPVNGAVNGFEELAFIFLVEQAIKGNPQRTTVILTANNGAACGAGFAVGQRWRVLANVGERGLASNLCNGTTLLADAVPIPELGTEPPQSSGPPVEVLLAIGGAGLVVAASTFAFTRRGRTAA